MGSKQSVVVPTQQWFFQKTVFGAEKSSKKLNVLMIFELLWQCIWLNYTSFKKIIAGSSESVEILPKCQKLINFFMWLFIFENEVFSYYYGYNRSQTPDFQI